MRRFGQEIRFRGAGGSVTVGVSFLVHSWCTITCKRGHPSANESNLNY